MADVLTCLAKGKTMWTHIPYNYVSIFRMLNYSIRVNLEVICLLTVRFSCCLKKSNLLKLRTLCDNLPLATEQQLPIWWWMKTFLMFSGIFLIERKKKHWHISIFQFCFGNQMSCQDQVCAQLCLWSSWKLGRWNGKDHPFY